MHVVFLSYGSEWMGIEYISALLKKHGHSTGLAHNPALFNDGYQLQVPWLARCFDRDDAIVQEILEADPDLIAVGTLTHTYQWALNIVRRVRAKKRIPTVFGGIHPSAVPALVCAQDEVDFVCEGEGEYPTLKLVEALEAGREPSGINNLWTKQDGKPVPPPAVDSFLQTLDELPPPDKELYGDALPPRSIYNIITARGCPYRCTFCFNNFFANLPTQKTSPREYLRHRSVECVLEELHAGRARFDFQYVEFHDDIFTMDKAWLKAFLPRYKKEIGKPFFCETHAKFIDEDLARLLKDSGCIAAKMGIQSLGDIGYKAKTLRRAEAEEDIVAAIQACDRAGLPLDVDHIFGLPDETPGAQERALKFYRKHTPHRIACFWLTYLPGIEMTRKAHERGVLTDAQLADINSGNVIGFHQTHALTEEERAELRRNQGYMAAFQVIPSLPRWARRFAGPWMSRVPGMFLLSWMVMGSQMLVDWLFNGYFVAYIYGQYYWHYLIGPGRRYYWSPPSPPRRPEGRRQPIPS